MRPSIKITSTLLMLATCLAVSPARAEWAPGGLPANLSVPISDGSGGLIGVGATNGAGTNILKLTAAAGAVQWSMTLLLGPSFAPAPPSAAAPDGSGGVVYANSAFTGDIFADRVSATGAVAWASNTTVCNAANPQNQPNMATDAAGNSYIVWHDERNGQNTVNQFFAQKLNPNGVAQWTANGVQITPVGNVAYTEATAIPVPDEAGGCYFIWADSRPGTLGSSDLYAQRITSGGTVAWAAGGVPVCVAAGQQFFIRAIRDGAGGMIAMWMDKRNGSDFDLYAQRLDNTGASLWTANGLSIANGTGDQNLEVMVEDGSGGAFMAWTDARNAGVTGPDIYAQHLNVSGTALWTAGGTIVSATPAVESTPNIVLDGGGGVVIAWLSTVSSPPSARAGHLNASGTPTWEAPGVEFLPIGTPTLLVTDGLGGAYIGGSGILSRVLSTGEQAWVPNYRSTISSITDVNADEGGWVTVNVTKPLSDGPVVSPVTNGYSLWRKRIAGSLTTRLSDDLHVLPVTSRQATLAKYSDFPPGQWDAVSYTPAIVAPSYSLLAPTHTDSTFQSTANDSFLVVAHTTTASIFVVSPNAGGHSVDNLSPGAPQNFDGGRAGGTTVQLHWSPNSEADLWHYSVYKGTSSSFTPSAGNRIGQPTTASLQDDAYDPGVSYYKLSATDRHGNESGFALLSPSQITSVPPGIVPARTYLARSTPNPFHSETAIEYGLAQDTRVSLVIYDLRGRRVARLIDGQQPAGVRKAVWDGKDDAHRLTSAGVYLLRFTAGGVTQTDKIVRTN